MTPLFYKGCHYGKPIVNLYLFHAAENPFHASKRILQNQYGVQLDWDTIQRYTERVADRYGIFIADCTLSMNFLSPLRLKYGLSIFPTRART
jgi:hypothetical protein